MSSRNATNSDLVQYDVPKNTHKRSQCDVNFEVKFLLFHTVSVEH